MAIAKIYKKTTVWRARIEMNKVIYRPDTEKLIEFAAGNYAGREKKFNAVQSCIFIPISDKDGCMRLYVTRNE